MFYIVKYMNLDYYIPDLNKDYYCYDCSKIINYDNCYCCSNELNNNLKKLISRYICDTCTDDYDYVPKKLFKTIEGDVCDKCFGTNKYVELTENKDLLERFDTIFYKIIYSNNINNIDVYVIYEYDNNHGMQYCEYFLLCIKDNKIILNYKIDTYNPYFGLDVKGCEIKQELNHIIIKYYEKHYLCDVTLEFDFTSEETQYEINGLYKFKPIGSVIEFKKGDKIMESKKYF